MIKRYLPKWNILLRDDKTVSYVRVDLKNPIPYVSITRNPLDDQAIYVGPFYAKSTIQRALRILRKVFPFYDRPYDGKKSLHTDLGLTPGLEIGRSDATEYKKNLRHLIRYLEGDRKKLLKELEKQMFAASDAGDYETAAKLRNQLFGLRELRRKIIFSDREFLDLSSDYALTQLQELLNLPFPPRRIEGFDISHQSGTNAVASMVVFLNGASARSEYRKFKIKEDKNNDFANMREVLIRRFRHQEWPAPDLILIDGGKPQLEAVRDFLDPLGIPYIGLAKQQETIILPLYHNNQDLSIEERYQSVSISHNTHIIKLLQRIRDESHRFAITYHRLLKTKQLLK